MTITLYKGVELRSDYSVIFDCDQDFWSEESGFKTPFARYLAEKQSVVRDIENTYFTNDGVLSIDWTVFDGDYEGFTYMSVLLDTGETKYFFIDSYEYLNEMLRINYSIDIWHTYSAKMKIYNGIIGRANKNLPRKRRTLPIAYDTNQGFNFEPLYELTGEVYLAAEFSFFQLQTDETSIDDAPYRFNYSALITHNNWSHETSADSSAGSFTAPDYLSDDRKLTYTIEEAIETINQLTAYQGVQPLGENKHTGRQEVFKDEGWRPAIGSLEYGVPVRVKDKFDIYHNTLTPAAFTSTDVDKNLKNIRYEIVQFFIIPDSFFESTSSMFETTAYSNVNASMIILDKFEKINLSSGNKDKWYFNEYQFLQLKNNQTQIQEVPFTFIGNQKMVGIGLKSLFIPVTYNYLDHALTLRITFSPIGFNLSCITNQGLIDITSQFEVPIPFTTLSATERQLAALSRQQAKRQKIAAIASLGGQVLGAGASIAGGITGIGAASFGANAAKMAGGFAMEQLPYASSYSELNSILGAGVNYANARARLISKQAGMISNVGGNSIGLLYAANNVASADAALKSPISAGQANNSAPDAIINAYYGFGVWTISPNNKEIVDYMIDRVGYGVFIESNDYHHGQDADSLDGQYEPIQFTTAQVTGPFSNDVRAALEAILLEGAIISYSPYIFDNL